ncbi:MAG: hypothetical protein QM831_37785 [Kofleriaceae bacterium]
MRGLREVEVLSLRMLTRICSAKEPWPFETLIFPSLPTAKQIAQLAKTQALPHWSKLDFTIPYGIEPPAIDALLALLDPIAGRLTEVTLSGTAPSNELRRAWLASVSRRPWTFATPVRVEASGHARR